MEKYCNGWWDKSHSKLPITDWYGYRCPFCGERLKYGEPECKCGQSIAWGMKGVKYD